MIPKQARRVIDTPDQIEAPAPVFHSRRKAGAVSGGAEARAPGANGFDPLEWQFFDFGGQAGSVDSGRQDWFQGFRWGVIAACCGSFIASLLVWVLA